MERRRDSRAAVSGGAADQFSVCTATLAHISTASTTQHHPLYQTRPAVWTQFLYQESPHSQAGSRVVTKLALLQTAQIGRGSELQHCLRSGTRPAQGSGSRSVCLGPGLHKGPGPVLSVWDPACTRVRFQFCLEGGRWRRAGRQRQSFTTNCPAPAGRALLSLRAGKLQGGVIRPAWESLQSKLAKQYCWQLLRRGERSQLI